MLFSPGVWVWTVTESGPWLSLDRNPGDWAWFVIVGDWAWIVIVADCAWILKDRSQLLDDWDWLVVPSCRPGGLPSLPIFENPCLEEDNPSSVTCGVWRRGLALSEFVGSWCVHARLLPRCWYSWVTCYPVFHCGRHGDISIFLLFICVTLLVCIRRYIVSVLHVQVK